MTADSSGFLPDGSPSELTRPLRRQESRVDRKARPRRPTIAMKLALSALGRPQQEGFVPMGFFAEQDIQIYLGPPTHSLNGLLRFSGQTTSRKIADAVFPWHRDEGLPIEERLSFAEGLPDNLKPWLAVVLRMIRKIREEDWEAPPISVLNFRTPRRDPWICRAEHLCGQVPDGAHRVLAYSVLGAEFPERLVRVRVLGIHPFALAVVNSLTIVLSFLVDPVSTPAFVQKRFRGSAYFSPAKGPQGSVAESGSLPKKAGS
jgi:hypothetical protein